MIKVNSDILKLSRFPDGTWNIKGNPDYNCCKVFLSWHYESDSEFTAIAYLTKYYQARECDVYLYLPYVPNARMDRIENVQDVFTLKYFGNLINSLNFKNVIILDDYHSDVTLAVFDRCCICKSDILECAFASLYHDEGIEKVTIYYPDAGAAKRYSKSEGFPQYLYGDKKREWETGRIVGLDIHTNTGDPVLDIIEDCNVVIRDDICSYGGTIYHSAKKLKELGAKNIYVIVTHCENSIFDGDFDGRNLIETGLINKIYTTDSIFRGTSNDMFTVFSPSFEWKNNVSTENDKCYDCCDNPDEECDKECLKTCNCWNK